MAIAPPSDAPTRERLLEAATALLRRSGLAGAGINEIVRESATPKGSVYHHFPGGKREIVAQALSRHAEAVVAFIDASLAGRRSPSAKVEALFRAFAQRVEEGAFRSSCPAGTVCLDLDDGLEGLRTAVAASFDRYVDAIARRVDLGSEARTRSFARLLLTAIQGAYIRCRAERSGAPFREAGSWLAQLAR